MVLISKILLVGACVFVVFARKSFLLVLFWLAFLMPWKGVF